MCKQCKRPHALDTSIKHGVRPVGHFLVTSQALRVDPSPTSSNVHAAASEYPLTPFQLLAPITGCVLFDVESLSLQFFSLSLPATENC